MTQPMPLADRFTCTIKTLLKVVADLGNRRRMHGPLVVAIWGRIRRLSNRFLRFWALYQAGKLRPPRVRARPVVPRPERPPRPPSLLPPQRFYWLAKLIQETAGFGAMLEDLLRTEPEIEAMERAAPQAGRVLRPLCAMLGLVPPEWLRLPKRVRRRGGATRPASAARLRPATRAKPAGPAPPHPPSSAFPSRGEEENKTGPPLPRPGGLYWDGVGFRWA
jgi:hypothetical protein